MTIADIIIIAVYIVAMFGVGVYARTRIKSVDDFLVAGNRFKTFSLVLCGTLSAWQRAVLYLVWYIAQRYGEPEPDLWRS